MRPRTTELFSLFLPVFSLDTESWKEIRPFDVDVEDVVTMEDVVSIR
jgi:hypothetical protein